MLDAVILIFRLLYPESVDLESTVYAAATLVINILLYRWHIKTLEKLKSSNIED